MLACSRKIAMAVLVPVFCVGVGQGANAYEEVSVTNGGTLIGSVQLIGDVPTPAKYELAMSRDSLYCGKISDGKGSRLLQPFHVGAQRAFQDVVVMLKEVAKGKPVSFRTPHIEAIDCTFQPFISVVWDKRSIEVVNMDPVFHDVQAYETARFGRRVLFNSPLLMYPGYAKQEMTKTGTQEHHPGEVVVQNIQMNKGRRVFVMQCGFHRYMEAWALVVDHPYYAVTDQEGQFKISDIPPGTYTVIVWHPLIDGGRGAEYQITIKSNQRTTLTASIKAPTETPFVTQLEEKPFDLGLGGIQTAPSTEKQTR